MPRSDGAFSPAVRAIIKARSAGYCERCALPLLRNGQVHHRRPRGMGGTRRAGSGQPANGLWVHPACHAKVESDREKALAHGWLVRQEQDPEEVPIIRYGKWVYLLNDGTVKPLTS